MLTVLTAVLGLSLWLPMNINIVMPDWFTQSFNSSIFTFQQSISPIHTPTPFTYPTFAPQISPTPKPSLKPTATPTQKPTPKPTIKPTVKPSLKPSSTISPSPTTTITSQNVLTALNNYRVKNGKTKLQLDQKLQDYAQSRANYLKSIGRLDNHSGFNQYVQNGGFSKLGFNALAENQSWNYQGTVKGLIEDFYAQSPGHNANQLNNEYTHVGIGISGVYTNLIFGGRKAN